jgi:hypothetical protein
MTGA